MIKPQDVTGVVLAGGAGRRMDQQDKGLIEFKQQALVSYPLQALQPLVSKLLISANRNQAQYAKFGHPVISDLGSGFQGPLAGILTVMQQADTPYLLVTPCDCPLITSEALQHLLNALASSGTDLAIATADQRWHPVFLAIKTHLSDNLQRYLDQGERKMAIWLAQQNHCLVGFDHQAEVLSNVNTLSELNQLEQAL